MQNPTLLYAGFDYKNSASGSIFNNFMFFN